MALFKAVVWALIFLTKLRFPFGVSIAIVLKDRYKIILLFVFFRIHVRIFMVLIKTQLSPCFLKQIEL